MKAKWSYDANGNPSRIYFTNGNITKYVYSATGQKLRVIHQTAVPNITVSIGSARELTPSEILSADSTDYLLGGSLTLRNGRIDKLQFEEGYCQAEKYASDNSKDDFYYYNRDHLGNIRQVVKNDGTTNGTVVQTMDYYPFGAQFCHSSTASDVQSRKYNGKEFDKMHGLNTYDYGARQYNPVTARWDRMDPLCEKYYSISPYAYCLDNPIMCIDPDGRNIYMLFYTVGNKDEEADRMFKAAAETRKQDIMKSKEFDSSKDIVILSSIFNLGSLGDIVNNIIDTYSEKYGKTAEFGFWSHSAFDGPAGTKTTSHDLTGNNQMSIEGWGKINFNWEENASAYFYGCRSGVPSKSGVSFTTNLSGQENFHNVSIYGQTSYSYPSKYTNIRETATNMLFGHFSYPTYMVGGYKKNGHLAYLSIIPALPMRRSVNGKEDLNKIYYQPGRKF